MKNFCFNTICNITQEPQELQRYNRACRFIGKSAVIKCHQVLSKVTSINRRSLFAQLATDTKYPYPHCVLPFVYKGKGSTWTIRIFSATGRRIKKIHYKLRNEKLAHYKKNPVFLFVLKGSAKNKIMGPPPPAIYT